MKSAEALQQDFADLFDDPKPDAETEAPTRKREVEDSAAGSNKKAKKSMKVSADCDGNSTILTTIKSSSSKADDEPSKGHRGEGKAAGISIEIPQAPRDLKREIEEQNAAEPQEAASNEELETDAGPKKKKKRTGKKAVDQEQTAEPEPHSTGVGNEADSKAVYETEGIIPACSSHLKD